jgi:hypothetical protein
MPSPQKGDDIVVSVLQATPGSCFPRVDMEATAAGAQC